VPRLEPVKRRFAAVRGELPSPLDPPSGCHFHPRCPIAVERCAAERPELRRLESGEGAPRFAACHFA
jgi:peptide/nickel transport system ATP-binding protein